MAQTLTGGCLCGAVRYKISGDQIFSGRCYCNDCRKTSGTGHSAVLAVAEQAVSITGKLTDYTKPGGSGQAFTRRFCPVCGSRVAGVFAALTLSSGAGVTGADELSTLGGVAALGGADGSETGLA